MSAIILPSRFSSQPQSAVPIDQSNPIANGLLFAFNPTLYGDGTGLRSQLNSYQTQIGQFGKSTIPLSAAPYPSFGYLDVKTAGSFSVVVLGAFVSPGSFTSPLISLQNASGGGWKLGISSNGAIGYTAYGVQDYVSSVLIAGFTGVISATINIGTSITYYKNGVNGGSSAIGAINASAGARYTIGNRLDGTDSVSSSTVTLALHFNRALSDAEHASLAANPWQLFKAPPRRLWLASSTPSGTGTGSAAGTSTALATGAATTASTASAAGTSTAAAGTATATIAGTLTWTDQNDTSTIGATVTNTGSLAWTEASDTTAITGTVTISGATLAWIEQSDATAISATVTNAGLLAWAEQNDTCAIIAASLVRGAVAWAESNDASNIIGYTKPTNNVAPITPQILNQPFNNSLFLDGILNDRSTTASMLESVLIDAAIVNTLIVDLPIPKANQSVIAIIPQV